MTLRCESRLVDESTQYFETVGGLLSGPTDAITRLLSQAQSMRSTNLKTACELCQSACGKIIAILPKGPWVDDLNLPSEPSFFDYESSGSAND